MSGRGPDIVVALLLGVGCAKEGAAPEPDTGSRVELVAQFDGALAKWDLVEAERLLQELEKHETPRDSVNAQRTDLAKRLLRPEVYDGAPAPTKRTLIEFTPMQVSGAASIGCAASRTEQTVHHKQPERARALFERASAKLDSFDAAYLAGELEPFETVWNALPPKEQTINRKAQRARVLVHAGRRDEAIAQAKEILTGAGKATARLCAAALLVGKLEEAAGNLDEARAHYTLATENEAFGGCLNAAQSRLAALEGVDEPPPGYGVRIVVNVPPGASDTVALRAVHPISGSVTFESWMGDVDPTSWHNADTTIAIAGHVDADGAWQFTDVPPGWYSIAIVIDGNRPAQTKSACVPGVHVVDGLAEAGPIDIAWTAG